MQKKQLLKKFYIVLLSILFVCSAFVLASCDNSCSHEYGDWQTVVASTCAVKGEQKATCKKCGDTKIQSIDFAEHSFGDWQKNEQNHWKKCTVCNTESQPSTHEFANQNSCTVCGYSLQQDVQQPASITYEEFMANHREDAYNFVNENYKSAILDGKTALSEVWNFKANSNGELTSVELLWTSQDSETERTQSHVEITLNTPLDLDKIVNDSYTANETLATITETDLITFDAKENYFNKDLKNAFANLCNAGEGSTVVFSNEGSTSLTTDYRIVVTKADNTVKVYDLNVDGTEVDDIIANLAFPSSYTLEEAGSYGSTSGQLDIDNYQEEQFTLSNVDELVENYGDEVQTALKDAFFEDITKACYGRTFNADNLVNYTWDLGAGNQISEIKFISYYQTSETSMYYTVGKISLETPISVSEITESNLATKLNSSTVTATQEYLFAYNPQIQTRNDLVNAIFEANGMPAQPATGAVRYLNDKLDILEAREFQVVEISENGVKEFSISIKKASTDEGFIENLSNASNYRIYDEKSCEMTGVKIAGEE